MNDDRTGRPRLGELLPALAWLLPLAVALAGGAVVHERRDTPQTRDLARARDDVRVLISAVVAPRPDDAPQPTTAEGLHKLVEYGVLPHVPIDPWGREYQYRYPGSVANFEVFSLGADGVESADDIVSWNLYGGR